MSAVSWIVYSFASERRDRSTAAGPSGGPLGPGFGRAFGGFAAALIAVAFCDWNAVRYSVLPGTVVVTVPDPLPFAVEAINATVVYPSDTSYWQPPDGVSVPFDARVNVCVLPEPETAPSVKSFAHPGVRVLIESHRERRRPGRALDDIERRGRGARERDRRRSCDRIRRSGRRLRFGEIQRRDRRGRRLRRGRRRSRHRDDVPRVRRGVHGIVQDDRIRRLRRRDAGARRRAVERQRRQTRSGERIRDADRDRRRVRIGRDDDLARGVFRDDADGDRLGRIGVGRRRQRHVDACDRTAERDRDRDQRAHGEGLIAGVSAIERRRRAEKADRIVGADRRDRRVGVRDEIIRARRRRHRDRARPARVARVVDAARRVRRRIIRRVEDIGVRLRHDVLRRTRIFEQDRQTFGCARDEFRRAFPREDVPCGSRRARGRNVYGHCELRLLRGTLRTAAGDGHAPGRTAASDAARGCGEDQNDEKRGLPNDAHEKLLQIEYGHGPSTGHGTLRPDPVVCLSEHPGYGPIAEASGKFPGSDANGPPV